MTEGIGCPLFWMVRLLKEREIRSSGEVRKKGCGVVGTCSNKGREVVIGLLRVNGVVLH